MLQVMYVYLVCNVIAEFLLGKCKRVHIHIRRIPMSEVPREEDSLRDWLHNLYAEKDK